MTRAKDNTKVLLDGIAEFTGIERNRLEKYEKKNNIFHIFDHPMVIGTTDEEMDKIFRLKDFIHSYTYLREEEKEKQIQIETPEKAAHYFISLMAYKKKKKECMWHT